MKTKLQEAYELLTNYLSSYHYIPNAILINEEDLEIIKNETLHIRPGKPLKKEGMNCELFGLKVIPIKYGKMKVVEVIEK